LIAAACDSDAPSETPLPPDGPLVAEQPISMAQPEMIAAASKVRLLILSLLIFAMNRAAHCKRRCKRSAFWKELM
jgi:hypothetical protein